MALPLSTLTLVPANRVQIYESRKRTYTLWGKGITLEEYLRRDARMGEHEVSRNNRLVTWILTRRDSTDSVDFLCSCETYRREGLVLGNSANGLQNIICYGIASVFTPVENRKKGYAQHMMRLLHWVIASEKALPKEKFPVEWGIPPQKPSFMGDGAFSVLYSDIGKDFYLRCGPLPGTDGWSVRDPDAAVWDVNALPASRSVQDWKWLDEPAVNEIWELDASVIKEEMKKLVPSSQTTAFTFLPDKGVTDWQYNRLKHQWEKLVPQPTHWGVCKNSLEGSLDTSTFATWALGVRPPVERALIITRLRAQPKDFEELLAHVVAHAKKHTLEKIEVWGLPLELHDVAHSLGGKTFRRDEHLSAFKWYGEEETQDVAWIHNEKFCWC